MNTKFKTKSKLNTTIKDFSKKSKSLSKKLKNNCSHQLEFSSK